MVSSTSMWLVSREPPWYLVFWFSDQVSLLLLSTEDRNFTKEKQIRMGHRWWWRRQILFFLEDLRAATYFIWGLKTK